MTNLDKGTKNIWLYIVPIMLTFFAMGFVDSIGVATNYMKKDFSLSDSVANLFPFMVFFWFLVCSVPTGIVMNKIGRKNTVLISLIITLIAVALPLVDYNFSIMMISFSLLGIGNAIMQVSLNPLLSNIVTGKKLSSYMTFGMFIKTIAAMLAPIIAGWAALEYGNWRVLFIIFLLMGIIAIIALSFVEQKKEEMLEKTSGFKDCFSMLANKIVLLGFIGIICHVGIDVGTNVSAPKLLQEKLGVALDVATNATVVYFFFRVISSFLGAFILAKFSTRKYFLFSVLIMGVAMLASCFVSTKIGFYICFAIIGFGNANIFPIILSQAMEYFPEKKNEVSGLMVMGIFGGSIFPICMGIVSDLSKTQVGAMVVMLIGVVYLLSLTSKIGVKE